MNPETPPISNNIANNQATVPSFVDNVTSQFIVTPTGNPTIIGVSGYIFSILGNEDMSLDAEITDAFTEVNISYQDQIAVRPEQFTLSGYVGELVNTFPNQFTSVLTTIALFGATPFMGATFNSQDEQFYDQLALVTANENSLINTAQSMYGLFSSLSTTVTNQQNAFQYFYNLWLSRTLCEVETPWGILGNMAILNVRARQDETTLLVSDFSVTFKAMRFATTTTTISANGTDLSTVSGKAAQTLTPIASTGSIVSGQSVNNSVLSQYIDNLDPSFLTLG